MATSRTVALLSSFSKAPVLERFLHQLQRDSALHSLSVQLGVSDRRGLIHADRESRDSYLPRHTHAGLVLIGIAIGLLILCVAKRETSSSQGSPMADEKNFGAAVYMLNKAPDPVSILS